MDIGQLSEFYQIMEEALVKKGYQLNPQVPEGKFDLDNGLMTIYEVLEKNEKLTSEDDLYRALEIIAGKTRDFFKIEDITRVKAHESEKRYLIEIDLFF